MRHVSFIRVAALCRQGFGLVDVAVVLFFLAESLEALRIFRSLKCGRFGADAEKTTLLRII